MDFGDVEAALVDIIRDGLTLTNGLTVSTNMVGYQVPDRWVRVQRTGGIPTFWMGLDNATITVEAYGLDKGDALDLAVGARAAVHAARETGYVGHGLRLYDITETGGLTWNPDDHNPQAARYTLTLSLVTKPEV